MATELLAERTYTRKVFDLGGGVRRGECHAGHIHYRDDATGDLTDVDYTWEDIGTHWQMTRASYRLRVAKDFAAPDLIRYSSRYEGANHDIYYEPHSLVWATRRDIASVQPFRTQQAVTGVLVGQTIRYTNAFGPGLDFEVSLRRSGFTKEIVIRRRNALDTPPTAQHRLVLLTRYRGAGLDATSLRNRRGDTWQAGETFDDPTDAGFELHEPSGKHSLIRPAYIEDASDRRQSVPVVWLNRNGALWQAKILPTAFLQSATYPVRADTVTSYYAGAGDGYITSDTGSGWDTTHDATAGTGANATGTNIRAAIEWISSGSRYIIMRMFLPFDTSGLPDGDTITAASVKLYVETVRDYDNDGDDWVNVIGPTSQASNTTLATGDFDQCGAINNPQEVSTRQDLSGISTGAYTTFALDATGLSLVSKTGYTLLGVREGHDAIDSAGSAASDGDNFFRCSSSEFAGTSQDPYLEVTYSTPSAAGPLIGGKLIGRGALGGRLVA